MIRLDEIEDKMKDIWFSVTFATSAVEGLHSFNAHHNQPRVTVDVHNQLPPIDVD